jgi:hypothetical protein
MRKVMELPESACTRCLWVAFQVAGINRETLPAPGDFILCSHCGHVMVFAANLTTRDPTPKELAAARANPVIMLSQKLIRGAV